MYLKYAKMRDGLWPQRANPGDAIDIYIPRDFPETRICPGSNIVIPSGLHFEVPFGYALMFVNKSGVAVNRKLIVGACLIDHGYAGEVHIDIHNIGTRNEYLKPDQKIAQLIQIPVATPSLQKTVLEDLYKDIALVSERGSGRMGSTGT